MLNEDYIASGILELYAAGGLTEAERAEVERQAAASPEIRQALDEACAAMESYASLYAVAPSPKLKTRIMQALSDEETPVRDLYTEKQRPTTPYKWMMAASVVLVLFTGFLSIYFYTKWQQTEEVLASVRASEQLMAQTVINNTQLLENQEQLLQILRNPDYKLVKLEGVEASPGSSMLVYWNERNQQVFIDEVALPVAPFGKQYQLWALQDGQPIDAGLIETRDGKAGLQKMRGIASAQAFAVTLEPEGGSESPTLEALTVMGNVDSEV